MHLLNSLSYILGVVPVYWRFFFSLWLCWWVLLKTFLSLKTELSQSHFSLDSLKTLLWQDKCVSACFLGNHDCFIPLLPSFKGYNLLAIKKFGWRPPPLLSLPVLTHYDKSDLTFVNPAVLRKLDPQPVLTLRFASFWHSDFYKSLKLRMPVFVHKWLFVDQHWRWFKTSTQQHASHVSICQGQSWVCMFVCLCEVCLSSCISVKKDLRSEIRWGQFWVHLVTVEAKVTVQILHFFTICCIINCTFFIKYSECVILCSTKNVEHKLLLSKWISIQCIQ